MSNFLSQCTDNFSGILRPRQQHMMPTMLHNTLAAITTLMMMAEAVVAAEHFELVEEGTDLEPRLFFAHMQIIFRHVRILSPCLKPC